MCVLSQRMNTIKIKKEAQGDIPNKKKIWDTKNWKPHIFGVPSYCPGSDKKNAEKS